MFAHTYIMCLYMPHIGAYVRSYAIKYITMPTKVFAALSASFEREACVENMHVELCICVCATLLLA